MPRKSSVTGRTAFRAHYSSTRECCASSRCSSWPNFFPGPLPAIIFSASDFASKDFDDHSQVHGRRAIHIYSTPLTGSRPPCAGPWMGRVTCSTGASGSTPQRATDLRFAAALLRAVVRGCGWVTCSTGALGQYPAARSPACRSTIHAHTLPRDPSARRVSVCSAAWWLERCCSLVARLCVCAGDVRSRPRSRLRPLRARSVCLAPSAG